MGWIWMQHVWDHWGQLLTIATAFTKLIDTIQPDTTTLCFAMEVYLEMRWELLAPNDDLPSYRSNKVKIISNRRDGMFVMDIAVMSNIIR